jgi:hypothetical protein
VAISLFPKTLTSIFTGIHMGFVVLHKKMLGRHTGETGMLSWQASKEDFSRDKYPL